MRIDECVIVGTLIKDNIVLGKNRDRNYIPDVSIYRENYGDLELAYMKDETTGWIEGINSNGICVVNSALMVDEDEDALNMTQSGKKSFDDEKMLEALKQGNIEDALKSLLTVRTGLKGHTALTDGNMLYTIEMIRKKAPIVKEYQLTKENPLVRTNHGEYYKKSGYTTGTNHVSSLIRKKIVEKELQGENSDDLFSIFGNRPFEVTSNLNVMRETDNMVTTSQLVLNSNYKQLLFKPIQGKVNFKGIVDRRVNKDGLIDVFVFQ